MKLFKHLPFSPPICFFAHACVVLFVSSPDIIKGHVFYHSLYKAQENISKKIRSIDQLIIISADTFSCSNGFYIPLAQTCDGAMNCGDFSDEDTEHAGCESR